ncbi:MAG: hypothetical protein QOJ32_140 [Frankiaceae bacterium]|jgi:hypothetical protein|nr:hypothetical protein [Frankiaceae bacterium]
MAERRREALMRLTPLVLLVALSAGLAVLVHVVFFRHYSTDADQAPTSCRRGTWRKDT